MRGKLEERSYWQQVRGLCILAVILIHVLAEYTLNAGSISNGILMLRQLVNFPVPVFIFLSGYFTNQEKVGNIKYFFMSRWKRLIIPYILWSLVYCMIRGNITNLESIINILINGTASWQLYYIVVLIQLVLLTPVLFYLQEKNLAFYNMLYIVTPLWMLIKYYVRLNSFYESQFPWCMEFLVFYLLGLSVGNQEIFLKITTLRLLRVLLLILLALSFLEGKLWLISRNFTMAMTQGKFSSYAYALCFIFYLNIKRYKEENVKVYRIYSNVICKKILSMLQITGNYSYGIFYIHCLILFACDRLWRSIVGRSEISGIIYCFVIFVATYIISFILAYGGTKIFGKKYAKIIGLI